MDQGRNFVIIDQMKIKEAETYYEKIKARSQLDDWKLKGLDFKPSIDLKKNGHRVLFPVIHKDCQFFQEPEHLCGCLAQILSNGEQLTKCGQLSLTNINHLEIPAIPYFAVQSVHSRTDCVSIIQGFILNKILRQYKYIKSLADDKPQQLFRVIMRTRDYSNDFTNRIKIDDRYNKVEGFEFYAACLLDWVKLNIPMRFKSCTHIECFDFTSIVFRLENEILKQKNVPEQERRYSKIICGFNVDGCYCASQCVASYENMTAELVIDYELMDAIRKSQQEAYKFIYLKQNKEIFDELTYADKQQNELPKQGNSKIKIKLIDSINIQPTTLKIGDYSVLQVMNLKNAQAVQKKTQFQKYQDIDISLICPISNKQIQYPARCLKCPQQQCADLKSMIQYLNDGKQNKSIQNFECPLCKVKQGKKYCDLVPQMVFYFDEFIMGIIMQNKTQENQTVISYQGSQVLLNEYKQQYRILRQEIQEQYPNGKVFYSNLTCKLNLKPLKDPLIIRECLEETRVSFEQFFNLFKQSGYLEDSNKPIIICNCTNCTPDGITRTDQLAYDEMLAEAIQVYTFQKPPININDKIEYDYNHKIIKQFQQFKSKTIFGKQFQIKEIQTSLLGILVIQNQHGLFLKNEQEILKQFNDVAASQQFKKWNIKVNSIRARLW